MKKIFELAITLVLIWLMIQFPGAMLSPGELVDGHQKIKDQCFSCHKPFWGMETGKCISCHKLSDIGKDTTTTAGVGAGEEKILFHQMLEGEKCISCHTDHKGLNPEFTLSRFEHDQLPKDLVSKCYGCHRKPSDMLHTQLSTACKDCHYTKGWKPSVQFKHELIVAAAKDSCSICHQTPNDTFHHLFDDNCGKCHNTGKWVPSTFDHSQYFQLDKDHNTKCITCHTNNKFDSYTCYGCHEHSPGKIQSEHEEEGIRDFENCVSCHKSSNDKGKDMKGSENETDQRESDKGNEDRNPADRKPDKKNKDRESEEDDD